MIQKEDICGTKHAFKNAIYDEIEKRIPKMSTKAQLVEDVVAVTKQIVLSDKVAQQSVFGPWRIYKFR